MIEIDKYIPVAKSYWISLIGLLLLIQIPLFFIQIPPLGDYPNHLARIFIIKNVEGNPFLGSFFEVSWSLLPNLAIDFILLVLNQVFSLYTSGKIFIGLTLLTTVFSVVYLHRAIFKRWSYWPFISGLFVFNQILMAGFLNYAFGIALSFLSLGIWIRLSDNKLGKRLFIGIILSWIIYFTHIISFGVFAFCVAVFELFNFFTQRELSIQQRAVRITLSSIPFVFPLLLFIGSSDFFDQVSTSETLYFDQSVNHFTVESVVYRIVHRFKMMLLTGTGYNPWLASGVLSYVGFILFLAAWKSFLHISWPLITVAGFFIMMLFLTPDGEIFHIVTLPIRFPIIIIFLLIAGTDIRINKPEKSVIFVVFVLFLCARLSVVTYNWKAYQAELTEFRNAFSHIPPGNKIFSIKPDAQLHEIFKTEPIRQLYLDSLLNLHQLQLLLAAERNAFMPYNFTHPQKQILRVREAYRSVDYEDGGVPTPWSMAMEVMHNPDVNYSYLDQDIWAPTKEWWVKFDYLTVLYPNNIEKLNAINSNQFELMYSGHWIRVYKIL